jgi:membrane protein
VSNAANKADYGANAENPFAVPAEGWRRILLRAWREAGDDNINLLASGVAFYGFLAMVPLLGSIVLSYGLLADPATVLANVRSLTSVMPAEAAKLIGGQLINVVTASGGKKGFGLLLALALALYGAMNGAKAVVTALNMAYEEKERRGFVRLNLVALVITLGAVALAIIAMIAIAGLGHLQKLLPHAPGSVIAIGKVASYAFMGAAGAAAAATLYRYAPDRDEAKWIWLTPGSVAVSILWLLLTFGFGFYVANFGSYDATYGSLGAVVVLLTWLYLSAYILLLGAELNSELERQTSAETTYGMDRPVSGRGADGKPDVKVGRDAIHPHVYPHYAQTPPGSNAPSIRSDRFALARDFVTSRTLSRTGRLVGLRRVGLASSILGIGGLSLLKTRGRAFHGFALIAVGAAIALLQRDAAETCAREDQKS